MQWFTRRRKKALFDALEKVKSGTPRHDPHTHPDLSPAAHNGPAPFIDLVLSEQEFD